MASDNMMPVKPIVLVPGIKQRIGIDDADTLPSSFNKAGFQKLTHYAAGVALIQAGAGG